MAIVEVNTVTCALAPRKISVASISRHFGAVFCRPFFYQKPAFSHRWRPVYNWQPGVVNRDYRRIMAIVEVNTVTCALAPRKISVASISRHFGAVFCRPFFLPKTCIFPKVAAGGQLTAWRCKSR